MAEKQSKFEYFIDPSVNCAFINLQGVADNNLILETIAQTLNDPSYQRGMKRCMDFRGVKTNQTIDEIEELAVQIGSYRTNLGTHREAVILDSLLTHGLFRSYQSRATNDVSYRVFNSDKEIVEQPLKEWLELPKDYIFPDIFEPF
ncbi:hypothetical protein [Sneathiella limimaris]|uniref:hypothetical protein n=1 Tax=Sneathiella limimaris TaxID=1964213 RepID=UPI00146D67C2|nr:hypothetical protein [Sneathiella limimaris]